MKKRVLVCVLIVCIFSSLLVAGCAAKEVKSKEKKTSKTESLSYISKNKDIEITLPDQSWKCTEDSDSQITFNSDSGVINIMHVKGENVASIQVPDSKEAYEAMIKGNFADVTFEVMQFDLFDRDGRKGYQAVIDYEDNNPDKYMVGYGTYSNDDGYTVAASLTKEDTSLLESLKQSVFGMKVLTE